MGNNIYFDNVLNKWLILKIEKYINDLFQEVGRPQFQRPLRPWIVDSKYGQLHDTDLQLKKSRSVFKFIQDVRQDIKCLMDWVMFIRKK